MEGGEREQDMSASEEDVQGDASVRGEHPDNEMDNRGEVGEGELTVRRGDGEGDESIGKGTEQDGTTLAPVSEVRHTGVVYQPCSTLSLSLSLSAVVRRKCMTLQ